MEDNAYPNPFLQTNKEKKTNKYIYNKVIYPRIQNSSIRIK